MNTTDWTKLGLSTKAQTWIEQVAQREKRTPFEILSRIIEAYMDLEEKHGEDEVKSLLEKLVHGPREIIETMETLLAETNRTNERANLTLSMIRMFILQFHSTKALNGKGQLQYTVSQETKETLYPEAPQTGGSGKHINLK